MNEKRDYNIGVFIPVPHEKVYQKELGNDKFLAGEAIAKKSLITAYKYLDLYMKSFKFFESKAEKEKRKHGRFCFNTTEELGKQFNFAFDALGKGHHMSPIDIISSFEVCNGYGGFNERFKEIDKEYQENKHKFKIKKD